VPATPEVAREAAPFDARGVGVRMTRLQPVIILCSRTSSGSTSTLELQQLLVEQGATVPLLLIYSARPGVPGSWSERSTTRSSRWTGSNAGMHDRWWRACRGSGAAGEVIEAVLAATDGMPLFVEELTKRCSKGGGGPATTFGDARRLAHGALDRLGPQAKEWRRSRRYRREFAYELLHAVHPGPRRGASRQRSGGW